MMRSYKAPPISKVVGGTRKDLKNPNLQVSKKDRAGWVTPMLHEPMGGAASSSGLPDWDSFITVGERQGRTVKKEVEEEAQLDVSSDDSDLSRPYFDKSFTYSVGDESVSSQTKARIHRSGSVDILIPRNQTVRIEKSLSPRRSTPRSRSGNSRGEPFSQTRPRPAVSQARGLERYFQAQQSRLENDESNRQFFQEMISMPNEQDIFDEDDGDKDDLMREEEKIGSLDQSEQREFMKPPKRLSPKRMDDQGSKKNHISRQETSEENGGEDFLQQEESFWAARQRMLRKFDDLGIDDHHRRSAANESYQNNRFNYADENRLLSWLVQELDRYSLKLFATEGSKDGFLSMDKVVELLKTSDRFGPGISDVTGGRAGWDPLPSLNSLPDNLKTNEHAFELWTKLSEILYELCRRDRHHKDINRENILTVHKTVKRLHEERQQERLRYQAELGRKYKEMVSRLEASTRKEVDGYKAQINQLERENASLRDRCKDLESEKHIQPRLEALLALEKHKFETELRDVRVDLEKTVEKLEKENRKLREEKASVESGNLGEIQAYKYQVERLQHELISVRDQMALDHKKEMAEQKQKHDEQYKIIQGKIDQLVANHAQYIQEMEEQQRGKLAAVRKEYNMQLEMARRATKEVESKLDDTKNQYRSKLSSIQADQRLKLQAYQRDLQRQKSRIKKPTAGLRRDDILEHVAAEVYLERESESPPPPPPLPSSFPSMLNRSYGTSLASRSRPSTGRRTGSPPPPPPPPPNEEEEGEDREPTFTTLLDKYIDG